MLIKLRKVICLSLIMGCSISWAESSQIISFEQSIFLLAQKEVTPKQSLGTQSELSLFPNSNYYGIFNTSLNFQTALNTSSSANAYIGLGLGPIFMLQVGKNLHKKETRYRYKSMIPIAGVGDDIVGVTWSYENIDSKEDYNTSGHILTAGFFIGWGI